MQLVEHRKFPVGMTSGDQGFFPFEAEAGESAVDEEYAEFVVVSVEQAACDASAPEECAALRGATSEPWIDQSVPEVCCCS